MSLLSAKSAEVLSGVGDKHVKSAPLPMMADDEGDEITPVANKFLSSGSSMRLV
jgi:hypothetical protein